MPRARIVSFKVTKADAVLIAIAAQRAVNRVIYDNVQNAAMDLTAVHANGCKMDLQKLLAASDRDFFHDMAGIQGHLDRRDGVPTAGQLVGEFLPKAHA
jgi:hypothetical protein